MALVTMEGFDDNLASTRHVVADGAVSGSYGKNGNGMRVGDTPADRFAFSVESDGTENTIGFNAKIVAGPATNYYISVISDRSYGAFTSYGSLALLRDPALNRLGVQDRTSTLWTADNVFYTDTWYYVEFQWVASNGSGSWELKIDGSSVLSASSRDTYHTYVPNICRLGGYDSVDVDDMYIDNFYQLDSTGSSNNDFLGITVVETDLPSGNGNSSDLLGSDGNSTDNYLLVDNNATAPPATTEYVESGTEGEKDTYAMSDLTTTGTVHGVMTSYRAQKDETEAKFIRPVIRSGTTDYVGTSVALSDSTYGTYDECWDVDPNTSSAWAYTAVNAAEVGVEVRNS